MNRARNIIAFIVLPVLFIMLLLLNSKIAVGHYKASAEITAEAAELILGQGESRSISVNVSNIGTTVWIPGIESEITLSYRIYDSDNNTMLKEGEHIRLPHAVKPGEAINLSLTVQAPEEPGLYNMIIDMVHEGVAWFGEQGSKPGSIKLTVTAGS